MRWPLWRAKVADRSMEPTLRPGDLVLLVRPVRADRPTRVRVGQIAVARQPGAEDRLLIKRVILAGPDGWFLDSDNPGAGAVDSWRFGAVPASLVEGRLLCRYWPPRWPRPRARQANPETDPGGDGQLDHPRPDQGT